MHDVSVVALGLNALFNLYTLFVSESVAPWFWSISIPASIGITLSIGLLITMLPRGLRPYLFHFAVLFGAMAALNILNTKPLLFISVWLLLSFAIALVNPLKPIARRALTASLVLIAAIGWGGVITRDN